MVETKTQSQRDGFFDPTAWHRTDRPNRICRRWFAGGVEVELRYDSGRWTWRIRNLATRAVTKGSICYPSLSGAMRAAFNAIGANDDSTDET